MKVFKQFVLGMFGGILVSLIILTAIYLSSLREPVYFLADPEMAEVRARLSQYQEWLSQADLYIVEKGMQESDSLRTAQSLAWTEYKKWRTHLGGLARVHVNPSPRSFLAWAFSLRFWVLPIGFFLSLLPAIFLGWRSRNRFRPGRTPRPSKSEQAKVKKQALSSFEEAVKQVALISELDRNTHPKPSDLEPPPTVPISISSIPETKPIPILTDSGLDSNILKPLPAWGEESESSAKRLSMEDEDGDAFGEEGSVMPPTTEVELVERRKGEVLKLARKGLTSSEISKRMRISQDQVEFIIRLRREKG